MGLLSRVIGMLNKADDLKTSVEYNLVRDRRYGQADRLAASGNRSEGVLSGIKQKYNDGTETTLRITWFAPEPQHVAIRTGTAILSGLRLGATVALRSDDDSAVMDWDAMGAVWGPLPDPFQRRARHLPNEGVSDTAQDLRVLRGLKDQPRVAAAVVSFDRVLMMGHRTDNWDIVLRFPDGALRTVHKNAVPFYAHWYVIVGGWVPAVAAAEDRAFVDWEMLSEERATGGGRWQDRPPAGSIAEIVLTHADAPPAAEAMSMGGPIETAAPTGSLEPLLGVSLEQWANVTAALSTAGVAPAGYDQYATAQWGLPPDSFTAADAAWQVRMRGGDWRVSSAMGEAITAAAKAQKAARKRR